MAAPDPVIRVAFAWAVAALALAVAAYLAFGSPAARGRRWLALYFALVGMSGLSLVGLLDGAAANAEAWRRANAGITLLRGLPLVAFVWAFPRPPRLRSWHAVVLGVVGAAVLADVALWWLHRPLLVDALGRDTLLHGLLRASGGFGLPAAALLASALWRTRGLPEAERRGATTLVVVVLVHLFTAQGAALAAGVAHVAGLPSDAGPTLAALGAWPGDCCGVALAASGLAAAVAWGAALALAWWRRHLLAAALIALGAVLAAAFSLAPANLVGTNFALAALGTLYVLHRHRALGGAGAPAWVHHALAGAALAVVFLLATSASLWVLPDAPLALAVGIFLGLALGAAAAVLVHPWGLDQVLRLRAPEGTGREARLAAYRVALQAAREAGGSPEALDARLRALRAELGVSEGEHAAMEQALRAGAGVARLEEGQRFLGRYVVVRRLGEGGAGAAYLCRDAQLGRDVVLKRLRAPAPGPEGLAALLREARAVAGLRHERVVTVYDVEQVGDEAFIVMEHVAGGSLAARIARGPLSAAAFRTVARDLLEGLEAVHAAGLVHRDVKPGNVLLTSEGRAKLADFGVARAEGPDATLQPAGAEAVLGTPRYMSPEQARGRPCTPRSDLFSAAATLYEAHTGRPYLEARPGESAVELQWRAADARPLRGWKGPPALGRWFARALHPDPARRFPSARAMRLALERLDDAPDAQPRRRAGADAAEDA